MRIATGIAYGEKGEYDKADRRLHRGHPARPERCQAYYNRGLPTRRRANTTRRLRTTPRPSGSTRKLPMAYCNRGVAYEKEGEHDKAIADCTEAIRLNPKLPCVFQPGPRLREKDEYDKAIADFTEAIRLDPKYAQAYMQPWALLY